MVQRRTTAVVLFHHILGRLSLRSRYGEWEEAARLPLRQTFIYEVTSHGGDEKGQNTDELPPVHAVCPTQGASTHTDHNTSDVSDRQLGRQSLLYFKLLCLCSHNLSFHYLFDKL